MSRGLIVIAGNTESFSLDVEAIQKEGFAVFLITQIKTLYRLPKLHRSLYAVVIDGDLFNSCVNKDYVKQFRGSSAKPLFVLTSWFKMNQLKQAIELGFDEYFSKPITTEQLIELFKKYDKQIN